MNADAAAIDTTSLINITVEDIYAQPPRRNAHTPNQARGSGRRPERHDVFRDDTKHLCGVFPPGDAAWWSVLDAAIHHLTAVAGRPKQAPPRLGPGPGTCAQVRCSENTAVRWCNDVSGAPCLDSPRLALPYLILPCLPLPRFASPCLALRSCCNHSGAG